MKRTSLFRTLLVGGVLAAAAIPSAGIASDGGGPGAHGHRGGIAARLMRVADEIGLTQDQKDEIRAILEANKPQAQALRTDMRSTLKALDEAIEGGADNDTIAELAIEAHALRGEARELKQAVRKEIGAVLTPEQKAQLKEMRAERRGKRGGHGRRGGRGL